MDAVRPLDARIVRPHVAAQYVSRMLDALPVAERPAALEEHRAVIDPAAYEEAATAFYVYVLRRDDASHVGVVGEVRTAAFLDGRVRGHEAVQPDRVVGLVEHFTSAVVRSELVALLHEPSAEVATVLAETLRAEPLLRFTGPDGWEQAVWRVTDAASALLIRSLSEATHYIADGHHRVAASLAVWEQEGRPDDAVLMCAMYPLDGLRLLAFHRRVSGPVATDGVLGALSDFDVRPVSGSDGATGCFGLYVDGSWYDVAYHGARAPGVGGLDVTLMEDLALTPLLRSHASSRVETSPALAGVDELVRACDEDGGALFTLRPPTVEQLIEIADRGEVMPPKSTYFDPKPYAGIFLR